jgi:hypothetical protein
MSSSQGGLYTSVVHGIPSITSVVSVGACREVGLFSKMNYLYTRSEDVQYYCNSTHTARKTYHTITMIACLTLIRSICMVDARIQ